MKSHTIVRKDNKAVHECSTVKQAEKWIAQRAKRDPTGVAAGRYTIDPNELAYKRWNELMNRKKKGKKK